MVIEAKNRTKLPVAYKIEDYGKIILELNLTNNKKFFEVLLGKNRTLKIIQDENINEISYLNKNTEIINWTDKIISNTELIRTIKDKIIKFKENGVVLTSASSKFKTIKKLKLSKSPQLKKDFLTADIETIVTESTHKLFLISFYDGKISKSFFIDDITSSSGATEKLIKDFIGKLFTVKNKNKKVYLHNFAGFDAFFLFKYLVKYTEVKPLIHNGEIISVECKYKGIKITFRDSYKHLLASLDELAKSFQVENKSIFPYFLSDIYFNGSFPEYKYFDSKKVTPELYKKVKKDFGDKIWNFKRESIKYCEQDCRSLHLVMSKYNELFFTKFEFNIHKYSTISSLAFANYRTNFMEEENICNITGRVYTDIKLGYTGGSTDMYIPKPPKGKKIYAYDVNSLYPSVMLLNKYPILNPTHFQGNILDFETKPFGFFYCKITAPDNLLHPILQIQHKTKDGVRTLSPLGKFEGIFFSEELYNAQKFGYKFEVL